MKIIKLSELLNGPCFQGDLMLSAENKLPDGVVEQKTNVIAHSETGHDHVAEYAKVLGGLDPLVMFLKPDGTKFLDGVPYVDIKHKRDFDTHESYRLLFDIEKAVPRIDRQEEFTPEGWRVVAD